MVLRPLSSSARLLPQTPEMVEIYQDAERFWMVDERWGMVEINLMRGQWRAWVLPSAAVDVLRCAEGAVLWPLAQLLRGKGLHLIPAVGVVRDNWGALVLTPFSLEAELRALLRFGFRLVGQRWTALREEAERIEMLAMPGHVERSFNPRLRDRDLQLSQWVDLTRERPRAASPFAYCAAVVLVEAGRRSSAHWNEVPSPQSAQMLRHHWPLADLHPSRRMARFPARVSKLCRCGQLQLSRRPEDLPLLLDSIQTALPLSKAG